MSSERDITALLRDLAGSGPDRRKAIYDRLIALVYNDLRERAHREFGHEWHNLTLQPTALVHEAYQRLIGYHMDYESREHFLNVAAAAMRRLLVEEARRKHAGKRWGGQQRAPLDDQTAALTLCENPLQLIEVDRAIDSLNPEQAHLVELRYFLGLSVEEAAAVLRIQPEALKKRWRVVKLL